jgi:hypothetical protein
MKRYSRASRDEQQAFLDYGDRVADGDTTPPTSDLESTYLRVQRAMRSSAAASQNMPDHLRAQMWEDIMQSAAAPAARPAIGRHSAPAPRRATPLIRMGWSGMANAALALLVVIAGFGAWRVFVGDIGSGGNGPTPSEGRYAQAPMTPVPLATEDAQEAVTACDFSRSVPIYSGLTSSPVASTVLYITPSGDLTLSCPDEPESMVLSRNVESAWETHAPGVIRINITNGDGTDTVLMNVMTKEWVELSPETFSSYLGDANMGSSLQISTVADAPDSCSLINLETMTWATLPELTGAKFPASAHLIVATAADNQGVAVAASDYRTEGSATLRPAYDAQGDVAVIEDDLETVHWISVPVDFPEVTNILLSPDAKRLAFVSNLTSHSDPAAPTSFSVIDVASGEEIVRSEPFAAPSHGFFQWIEEGDAVVYATESAVYRLQLESGAPATELYASDGTLMLMPATTQTNVVHLQEFIDDETSNLVILTTDTEGMVTLAGEPWFAGTTPVMVWTEQLAPVVVMPNEATGETVVVHPVTGEPIMEPADTPPLSTPADGEEVWSPPRLVQTASHAPISVIDLGTDARWMVDLSGVEAEVRELAPLPEDVQGDLRLSPDGTVLAAGGAAWESEPSPSWALDLTAPDSEWVMIPEGSSVTWLVPVNEP